MQRKGRTAWISVFAVIFLSLLVAWIVTPTSDAHWEELEQHGHQRYERGHQDGKFLSIMSFNMREDRPESNSDNKKAKDRRGAQARTMPVR